MVILGRIKVNLRIGASKINVQRPGVNDLPLLDVPLLQIFKCLSHENIIKLFAAVLTEQQVVLVGPSCAVLTVRDDGDENDM